jgi:hypothetical protein
MPKSPYPARGRNADFERSAQRIESAIERAASSSVAGKGVHSSNAIVISAPRRR